MSDTPRTDAAVETAWCGCFSPFVDADFARELERELAAAKKELEEERFRLTLNATVAVGDLRNELRSKNKELAAARKILDQFLNGPPAQMTTPLGLLPINSTGMRTLVYELAAARLKVELAEGAVDIWKVKTAIVERELAAARAELERAMKVIDAAIAFLHVGGDRNTVYDMKEAVKEWEAGR